MHTTQMGVFGWLCVFRACTPHARTRARTHTRACVRVCESVSAVSADTPLRPLVPRTRPNIQSRCQRWAAFLRCAL